MGANGEHIDFGRGHVVVAQPRFQGGGRGIGAVPLNVGGGNGLDDVGAEAELYKDGGAQFGKGLEFGQRSAVLDWNAGDKNFVVMMAMKFGDGLGHGIIGAPALNDEDAAGNGVVDGKEGMDAPHGHHGHKDEAQDESQPAAQGG